MSKLWKRSDETDLKSRLVEIKDGEMSITSPTVVFLTGFSTTNEQVGFVAGSIKRLETLFGGTTDVYKHVKICAWSHRSLKSVFNMVGYNTLPSYFTSNASNGLAREVLMPLLANNFSLDEKGKASGEKISMDEAKARLKNLTFFGYSMGTVLAQEAYNSATKMMKQIGYNKDECKSLLNEVTLISVGNMSRPAKEKNRYTTVYLAATNDRLIKYRNLFWPSVREFFARWTKKLHIRHLSKHSLYVTSPVKKDMYEWKEEKGKQVLKGIEKLYPKWMVINSRHELPHYLTNEDQENPFSRIAKYSLTNAIKRESKMPVRDLLEPVAPLAKPDMLPSEEEIQSYKKRLTLAMQHKQFVKSVPQCK